MGCARTTAIIWPDADREGKHRDQKMQRQTNPNMLLHCLNSSLLLRESDAFDLSRDNASFYDLKQTAQLAIHAKNSRTTFSERGFVVTIIFLHAMFSHKRGTVQSVPPAPRGSEFLTRKFFFCFFFEQVRSWPTCVAQQIALKAC